MSNFTPSTFQPDESWLDNNGFIKLTTYQKVFWYGYIEFESNDEVTCRWTYFIGDTHLELCLKNEKDYCKLLNLFNHFGGENNC